jgi:hypothetical protein
MRKFLFPALGATLLAASVQPAMAQPAPGQYPNGQYQGGQQGGQYQGGQYPPQGGQYQGAQQSGGGGQASSSQAAASRLHEALHLNADQETAWRAYQAAIAPDPQQTGRSRAAQQLLPNLTTPRRLALMRAEMQSDMTVFDHNAQAVTTFYNTLTPTQQVTFDTETARSGQQQQR